MKFFTFIFLIVCTVLLKQSVSADVRRAIANAQAGLNDALSTGFPAGKAYVRLEKRDDGILIYKVSMKRVDDHTVRIRIIGFNGVDEITIVTYRIIDGSQYKTIERYQQQKHSASKRQRPPSK